MSPQGTVCVSQRLLRASAAAVLAASLAMSLVGACTTGAVAITQCREIESARCEASLPCGVISDVDECKRFYRDQCLHGIAGPDVPTTEEQDDCVGTITRAGECALDDPERSLADCLSDAEGMGGQGSEDEDDPDVCEFVAAPWQWDECDFLNEAPEGGSSG